MTPTIELHAVRPETVAVERSELCAAADGLGSCIGWLGLGRDQLILARVDVTVGDRRIRSSVCGGGLVGRGQLELFLWVPRRHDQADVVLVQGLLAEPSVSWRAVQAACRLPVAKDEHGLAQAMQRLRAVLYAL